MNACRTTKLSASGIAYTGRVLLCHIFVGTDGANDPELTVYDGITTAGTEIVPTATYDASALGLNGFTLTVPIDCKTGIYVEITCGGTVEIIIGYEPRDNWGVG
jgi:hypothetical protein